MNGLTLAVMAAACLIAQVTAQLIPGAPIWLAWAGQIAMPLCAFLVGRGFERTRNRVDFLIRLHMASVMTAALQTPLHIDVNPFPALVQIALLVTFLFWHDRRRRLIGLGAYVLWQAAWFALLNAVLPFHAVPALYDHRHLVAAFFGLVPMWDYRACFIVLGVLLWRFRRSPAGIAVVMTAFSLLWLAMMNTRFGLGVLYLPYRIGVADPVGMSATAMSPVIVSPTETAWSIALQYLGFDPFAMGSPPFGPQSPWMMIFALPLMLACDRRRGFGEPRILRSAL
ncbi:hypothetical protein [Bifidobacterium avesanii]|uniref:Uncharacterized protein n=1 Tax=Bifidobacterium avesanii TaxID=1798157 RepID=A0A7K3THN6_9BIFI|nr:hypothetical protein [Bifidobacterium avesanii]KAB8292029.1 TraX protein [Bifidobacterium avesanii]NEG78608.1 hypothetical protein [Bifidobacterium avesanii]